MRKAPFAGWALPHTREGALLLGLDFDGTLAPIAPRPDLARLPARNRRLLEILAAKRNVVVVIVSGRALKDVKAKVGVPGVYHAGNHGLEIEGPDGPWVHPQARTLVPVLRGLAGDIRETLGLFPGVLVEDKALSLSVHYRLLPRAVPTAPLSAILRKYMAPCDKKLRLTVGHKVWEIRPRVQWDKGHALLKILRPGRKRWTAALVGDDATDEEGFRTLGPESLTVRVGRYPNTSARFWIRRQADVSLFLEFIAREWN